MPKNRVNRNASKLHRHPQQRSIRSSDFLRSVHIQWMIEDAFLHWEKLKIVGFSCYFDYGGKVVRGYEFFWFHYLVDVVNLIRVIINVQQKINQPQNYYSRLVYRPPQFTTARIQVNEIESQLPCLLSKPLKISCLAFFCSAAIIKHHEQQIQSDVKKTKKCLSKFKHLEINRFHVGSFIDIAYSFAGSPLQQKNCTKDNLYKYSNAHRFYLPSRASHRSYSESISPFQQNHNKLGENISQRSKITRPQTCKARHDTEQFIQTVKSREPRRRAQSSTVLNTEVHNKKKKCTTAPQFSPWETIEDKVLPEW